MSFPKKGKFFPGDGSTGCAEPRNGTCFAAETITSSLKVFVRSDRTTFTGQGYAFMGLYRPEARGSGNDIALSTNPAAHLSLKALWLQLERLEEEKWTAFAASTGGFPRPRDPSGATNRVLVSHGLGDCPAAPCIEPWWDDAGRLTLIGAPRAVDHKGSFVNKLI